MATKTVIVKADLELQATDRFHRVPFEVPAGTESVGVRIQVKDPTAVVDVGCEGAAGWRGWSGGARNEFTIGSLVATPGYVPGPLESGVWAVVLGLHNLPSNQVEVAVQISIPSEVPFVAEPQVPPLEGRPSGSSRELPAPDGFTWYAGDFHAHSRHSDGSLSVAEVARLGVLSGLDFLAVTDHNTVSHHSLLPTVGAEQGITLIPGQEVTTHRGHANVFGDVGWIDFRRPTAEWVQQAYDRGAVMSLNHPIDADCSWLDPLDGKPAAVEFWHSTWYRNLIDDGILAWYAAYGHDAVLLGGSDFHNPLAPIRPGLPTTWVLAKDNTVGGILEGVKAGRTALTGGYRATPAGAAPDLLHCPIMIRLDDESLHVLAGEGTLFVDFAGERTLITSDYQVLQAPLGPNPYFLIAPDRTMLAISK